MGGNAAGQLGGDVHKGETHEGRKREGMWREGRVGEGEGGELLTVGRGATRVSAR